MMDSEYSSRPTKLVLILFNSHLMQFIDLRSAALRITMDPSMRLRRVSLLLNYCAESAAKRKKGGGDSATKPGSGESDQVSACTRDQL